MRGLLASAASPCACGKPLQPGGWTPWHTDEDGTWRYIAHAVCAGGCCTLMQLFPPAAFDENHKDAK